MRIKRENHWKVRSGSNCHTSSLIYSFIDIEGTFEFSIIHRSFFLLKRRNTLLILLSLDGLASCALLKSRIIKSKMGNDNVLVYQCNAVFCQGGVLSPLFWFLVVDNLIKSTCSQKDTRMTCSGCNKRPLF